MDARRTSRRYHKATGLAGLLLVAAIICAPAPAPADQALAMGPEASGFGFCDREAGTGDPHRTTACAVVACEADGGFDCEPVAWCATGGWAGFAFGYNVVVGYSNHFGACGIGSLAALEAALLAQCEGFGSEDCGMFLWWDPEGRRHQRE